MKRILFLTKDAFGKFYLPVYGNKFWKTPNIDELAKKGSVFRNHYTAAPSSNMSYYSMFTGQFPMQSKIKTYKPLKENEVFKGKTFFDKAREMGYECHVVWDSSWAKNIPYVRCFGEETEIHNLDDIRQPTGFHAISGRTIVKSEQIADEAITKIEKCIREIVSGSNVFVWVHLPHVINGRTGYGDDIDLFDRCVGMFRKYFDDENIFISADHGNMNYTHNKTGYGFDVYQEAICIPLIAPLIDGNHCIDKNTSSVDIFSIIFDRKVIEREFIFSDSAYHSQTHRKLAIIHNNYKLIYNSKGKTMELYDLSYDPTEQHNLISCFFKDIDRGMEISLKELYFYPYWDKAEEEKKVLQEELKRIWKNPTLGDKIKSKLINIAKRVKRKLNFFRKKAAIHSHKHKGRK